MSPQLPFIVAGVLLSIVLSVVLSRYFKPLRKVGNSIRSFPASEIKPSILRIAPFLEVLIIIIWAMYVGRGYLNLNSKLWPTGGEFNSAVQTHAIWLNLPKCGDCVLWNGFARGGAPAFAELHGSFLYPLVMPLTFLLGVVNGAKMLLIFSMIMGGLAQWWLARILRVSWPARLWAAGMGVVGGHLSGRMELGAFGMTLSVAACALVIPAAIQVGLSHGRKYVAVLAALIGLALLAGQGYSQSGLILGVFPAFGVFLLTNSEKLIKIFKNYFLAICLAVLIAGVMVAPFAHFFPEFTKDGDSVYSVATPLINTLMNLVIDDPTAFSRLPNYPTDYPHLHVIYIGWIAALFAVLGIFQMIRRMPRVGFFLLTSIALVFLVASAVLLRPLAVLFPKISGIRHSPQIAAVAIPMVLAFSSVGMDWFLIWVRTRVMEMWNRSSAGGLSKAVSLVLTAGIFLGSWLPAEKLSHLWYQTVPLKGNIIDEVLAYLETPTTEVVDTPYGEHFWILPAVEKNLKLGRGIRAWDWLSREFPQVYITLGRPAPDNTFPILPEDADITIVTQTGNEYASVQTDFGIFPCQAFAIGGHIDVSCDTDHPGVLTVTENNWDGWNVWVDGEKKRFFTETNWLAVRLTPGQHKIKFRYQPWDVYVGLTASLIGWGACVLLWIVSRKEEKELEFSTTLIYGTSAWEDLQPSKKSKKRWFATLLNAGISMLQRYGRRFERFRGTALSLRHTRRKRITVTRSKVGKGKRSRGRISSRS